MARGAAIETLRAALAGAGVALRPLERGGPHGLWTRLRPLFDVAGVEIDGLTPRDVAAGDEIAFCEGPCDAADWLATPATSDDTTAPARLRVAGVCFALRRADQTLSRAALRPLGVKLRERPGHLEGRGTWFRRRS